MYSTPDRSLAAVAAPRHIIWLMFAIGFLMLLYTSIRAASLTFTIDEIFSLEYIHTQGFQLYPETYDNMAANNHWLNSFFLWLFSKISTAPFVLRLPQLVSHALFLLFSAKIILQLRKDLFAVGMFIIINVHPYMLDFFSLARGYGLSLGCMMVALYYLVSISRRGVQLKPIILLVVFGALSVFSSFVMLNFFIAALSVAGLLTALAKIPARQKMMFISILLLGAGLIVLVVAPHLLKMREADALFFGSSEFWNGTVRSLAGKIMYEAPYAGKNYFIPIGLSLIAMLLLIIVALIIQFRGGMQSLLHSFTGSFVLLLAGIILMFVVQGALFGTLYPLERTGLFLLILFLFTFTATTEVIIRNRVFSNVSALAMSLPLLFHFAYSMNNSYVLDWKESGNADKIFEFIAEDRHTRFSVPEVWVSADPLSGYTLQYICRQRNATWLHLSLHWETGPMPPGNYYIVEERMLASRDMNGCVLLYTDELTGNRVFLETNER